MLNEKIYKLDGVKNGLAVMDKKNNSLVSFDGTKKFCNMDLLMSSVERNKNTDLIDTRYELVIMVGNQFIPWSMIHEREEWYEVFGSEEAGVYLSIFVPECKRKVIKAGYICFGDSYKTKILDNLPQGKKILAKNYDTLMNACAKLLREGKLKEKKANSDKYVTFSLPGTTLCFNFIKCYDLIHFNKARQTFGIGKPLPFKTDMDRYKTIHFFITKDISDSWKDEKNCMGLMWELVNEVKKEINPTTIEDAGFIKNFLEL